VIPAGVPEVNPPPRVVNTFDVGSFPGAIALEKDESEPVGEFTRVTIRWKYQRREPRDKMARPAMEGAVSAMWENVYSLLKQGPPASVSTEA
jgi:hypothetical protein